MAFTHVLLTGASSGIGRALAVALAGPGVTLHLGGRDEGRLQAVAAQCLAKGAVVHPRIVSVTDAGGMDEWIENAGPLDLVIANAGISGGTGGKAGGTIENAAQTRAIFATNLTGALNTVLPTLEKMSSQPPGMDGWRGQIACIASIAAFIALPQSPSYCAAKAALDRWTVATAPQARRAGIKLVSVCPGYVRTPMTCANQFPMPGLVTAERAADLVARGLESGQARVVFPRWFGFFTKMSGLLPPAAIEWATQKAPAKGAIDLNQ